MPDRCLVVGHADLHGTAGGGDDVDHRADRGRRAGRVNADRRAVRAGPVPRPPRPPRHGCSTRALSAPISRLRAEPALLEVDHEHLGSSLARDQADALANRPGAEHDDALAGLDPTAVDGAHRDRHRLGHRRDHGVVRLDREDLGLARRELVLKAPVEVDADQLEVVARVRASDAARVAMAAGVQRVHGHSLVDTQLRPTIRPDGGDRAGDLVALDAGELRTAGRIGQLAGKEVVIRAADADRLRVNDHLARTGIVRGSGRSTTAIVPTRSVTAARMPQPHTSAAVSTISSSFATCSS